MDSLYWYQNNYMVILIFLVIGIMLPIVALTIGRFLRVWYFRFTVKPKVSLTIGRLIRPKGKSDERNTTYESGIEPSHDARVQFNVHYYMFALMFVIFSVETIFLFPWAVAYHRLGLFALVEMLVFALLLLIGLIYAWRKKVLKWN